MEFDLDSDPENRILPYYVSESETTDGSTLSENEEEEEEPLPFPEEPMGFHQMPVNLYNIMNRFINNTNIEENLKNIKLENEKINISKNQKIEIPQKPIKNNELNLEETSDDQREARVLMSTS